MSETSDMIRDMFGKGDDVRDAGLMTPENIVRYDDIMYGSDSKWQVLDVYRPKNAADQRLPVIVSVHGGAWVYGDKERYQYYCMYLAQKGFAVVNFTYHLAPEFQFPVPLEDTNMVFGWVMEHAEEFFMDTDNVFAVGDSAGAHILSLYAAVCTNPDYAGKYEFKVPENLKLNAIVLNCGVYYMDYDFTGENSDLTEKLMQDFLPGQGTEEELYKISTVNFITKEYPPVYFMTAIDDFLKDQAPILQNKLMEKEINFVFRFFGSGAVRLSHVFHLNMRSEEAEICNNEEIRFLEDYRSEKV